MKAKRKHPASPHRQSARDMMKENQKMEGDDKVGVDNQRKLTKLLDRQNEETQRKGREGGQPENKIN